MRNSEWRESYTGWYMIGIAISLFSIYFVMEEKEK